jgi:hypothetical protein
LRQIGRKIFYDKTTGNVITDTGERQGAVRDTTIEQDIATYKALSERNRDTIEVLFLPFGARKQDFAKCNGYRVNPETRELEFSYPSESEPQEIVYQKPMSEEIKELKAQLQVTQSALDFLLMGGF